MGEGESVSNTRLGEICQALLRIIPEHPSSLLKLTTDTNKLIKGKRRPLVSGLTL